MEEDEEEGYFCRGFLTMQKAPVARKNHKIVIWVPFLLEELPKALPAAFEARPAAIEPVSASFEALSADCETHTAASEALLDDCGPPNCL